MNRQRPWSSERLWLLPKVQYVLGEDNRYGLANLVDETLGVPTDYLLARAS